MEGASQSDITELDLVRHPRADLHDDLIGKIARFRQLTDLGLEMGRRTMIFGGQAAYHTWSEARSSFVHGNYAATLLLCQSIVENLLAAFLHAGLWWMIYPNAWSFAKHCDSAARGALSRIRMLKTRPPDGAPRSTVAYSACP